MKWPRILIAFLILLILATFFAACKKEPLNNEKIAVIDMSKAILTHPLYPAWKMAVENEKSAQRLKDDHVEMVKKQTAALQKMQELEKAGKKSYFQADYAIKMSEAHLAERERLNEIRRMERKRIMDRLQGQFDAIDEEYKLPLFNLKMAIEAVKPLPRTREEGKQRLKDLQDELQKMQAEKADRINKLHQDVEDRLKEAMKRHEEESVQRLKDVSRGIYADITGASEETLRSLQQRNANIPQSFNKTLESLDKQLIEQKQAKDKLHHRMYSEISSIATKIAIQKNMSAVLVNVKQNIAAEDITDEVVSYILKNKESK